MVGGDVGDDGAVRLLGPRPPTRSSTRHAGRSEQRTALQAHRFSHTRWSSSRTLLSMGINATLPDDAHVAIAIPSLAIDQKKTKLPRWRRLRHVFGSI